MIEEALYKYLRDDAGVSALVSDRIYPLVAPQGAIMPAIVHQRITTARPQTLDGSSGVALPWFQFRCWAATYDEACALAEAVRLALLRFRGGYGEVVRSSTPENETGEYDSDAKLYGPLVEFRFTQKEA